MRLKGDLNGWAHDLVHRQSFVLAVLFIMYHYYSQNEIKGRSEWVGSQSGSLSVFCISSAFHNLKEFVIFSVNWSCCPHFMFEYKLLQKI
jgi:uncharacterized membrane protein